MFGAKRDIKVPQLYALANAMGVTVVDIMQDAERIRKRAARQTRDPGLETEAGEEEGDRNDPSLRS